MPDRCQNCRSNGSQQLDTKVHKTVELECDIFVHQKDQVEANIEYDG
jgi:hypothetical protein